MIRKIELDKDYETLSLWLKNHNKPSMNKELFSDSGFMVDEIVAGFLYKTNSSICLVENFISDPASEKNARRTAINTLFKTIIEEAKSCGFKMMFTSVILNSLHKNLKEVGFVELPHDQLMFRSL
jgi:hypothetical protein